MPRFLQPQGDGAADVSGPAGDEHLHAFLPPLPETASLRRSEPLAKPDGRSIVFPAALRLHTRLRTVTGNSRPNRPECRCIPHVQFIQILGMSRDGDRDAARPRVCFTSVTGTVFNA